MFYIIKKLISHFVVAVRNVFSLRVLLTILLFGLISYSSRAMFAYFIGVDLSSLIGYMSTVLPAGIFTKIFTDFAFALVNEHGLKQAVGAPSPTTEFFSSTGSGNPPGYSYGSGSNSGSGFRPGETAEELRARSIRDLEEHHARFNEQSGNNTQAQAEGVPEV